MATISVTDPGDDIDIQPNMVTAEAAAVDGDTLLVPEGIFIFNSTLTTTKKLKIKSVSGSYKTIFYRSEATSDATLAGWHDMIVFNINDTAASGIRVEGITFRSKKPQVSDGDGLSTAADSALKFNYAKDFVVTNCIFNYFGDGAITVVHDDSVVGACIYENQFFWNRKGKVALGLGYGIQIYGRNSSWISNASVGLGGSNFIFIEDNIFQYHRHSIASGGCAKYVARYNTISDSTVNTNPVALDGHPPRGFGNGVNFHGARGIEIYNNRIINQNQVDNTDGTSQGPIIGGLAISKLQETAVIIQNGDALIWGNYVRGFRFLVGSFTGQAASGVQTMTITGATNASPIVITTSAPSSSKPTLISTQGGTISGVGGNTAANVTGYFKTLSANTYEFYSNIGLTIPIVGNGVYTSGGTISVDYPLFGQNGHASALNGSPNNVPTGTSGDGDMFYWNNDFLPYNSFANMFHNYNTSYFVSGRDFQPETAKPGYTPYTYPHPLRLG